MHDSLLANAHPTGTPTRYEPGKPIQMVVFELKAMIADFIHWIRIRLVAEYPMREHPALHDLIALGPLYLQNNNTEDFHTYDFSPSNAADRADKIARVEQLFGFTDQPTTPARTPQKAAVAPELFQAAKTCMALIRCCDRLHKMQDEAVLMVPGISSLTKEANSDDLAKLNAWAEMVLKYEFKNVALKTARELEVKNERPSEQGNAPKGHSTHFFHRPGAKIAFGMFAGASLTFIVGAGVFVFYIPEVMAYVTTLVATYGTTGGSAIAFGTGAAVVTGGGALGATAGAVAETKCCQRNCSCCCGDNEDMSNSSHAINSDGPTHPPATSEGGLPRTFSSP